MDLICVEYIIFYFIYFKFKYVIFLFKNSYNFRIFERELSSMLSINFWI